MAVKKTIKLEQNEYSFKRCNLCCPQHSHSFVKFTPAINLKHFYRENCIALTTVPAAGLVMFTFLRKNRTVTIHFIWQSKEKIYGFPCLNKESILIKTQCDISLQFNVWSDSTLYNVHRLQNCNHKHCPMSHVCFF